MANTTGADWTKTLNTPCRYYWKFEAYACDQGLQENFLAVVRGVGAVSGIACSFAYTRLR